MSDTPVRDATPAADTFVIRLGRALHAYGTPIHRLEAAVVDVARHYGVEAQVMATPTSVLFALGADPQRVSLVRAEPAEIDLGKLARIDALLEEVFAGRLDPTEATARLRRVVRDPPGYGDLATVAATAVASAGAARFFGGDGHALVASGVVGAVLGAMGIASSRTGRARRVLPLLQAVAGAVLAALLSGRVGEGTVSLVTLAGVIVLLPGLSLTVAMTELSTRHLVAGTARLFGALTLLLEIGVGVAIGARLGVLLPAAPPWLAGAPLPAWTLAPTLLVSPLAIAVVFRAPLREAPYILVASSLAWSGGQVGGLLLGPELGAMVGAWLAGVASNVYARWRHRPSATTLIPALLVLVPGSIAFRGTLLLVGRDPTSAIGLVASAVLVAVAIAAGLVVANATVAPRRAL